MDASKLGIALLALLPVIAGAQQTALTPVEEYESLLRETRGLQVYNDLRGRQIARQETDLVNIQQTIEDVPDLQLQLPELLIRMVDDLRTFVELDFPLLVETRTERVNNLYALIEDEEQSDTSKLRRILEAWMIEVEYGTPTKLHLFDGKMPVGNPDRDVEFLGVGRIGLFYQTPDEEALTGAWDYRTNSWVELGAEHRNSVRQALRMARNQIAPELVLLPTVPPQND